ncbi:MAG: tetratricopeptide repeat protein [Elusimicrobiales bacterium]|nr:tetratricopeptide repeat protein [Elusimicrobiales bacterium]
MKKKILVFAMLDIILALPLSMNANSQNAGTVASENSAQVIPAADIIQPEAESVMSEPEISSDTVSDGTPEFDPAAYEAAWKALFPFSPASFKDPSPLDTRSFREISQDEYWFIKENMASAQDDESRKALLLAADSWLEAYKDSEHCDDVLLAKAELLMGIGDNRKALIALMKHRQTYPDSILKNIAKEKTEQLAAKLFKKRKDAIIALAEAEGEGRVSRLARLYSGLAEQFGDDLFEPLVAEFKELIASAPVYAYRDRLIFSLAQLYHSKGYYDEASLLYSSIIRLYPQGAIIPVSKLALAEINAREKRNYQEAIRIYKEIAFKHEGKEEAFIAYKELPRLLERQKQYEEAVNVYEKIIELYPDKPEARDAYRAEMSILRYELKRYPDAINVIKRMAGKYKDSRSKNDLYAAAEIARNNLKNLEEELAIYEIILADYPDPKNAPAALLAAAQACDKAKQTDRAKEYYKKITKSWPSTPQGKKAEKALMQMSN